MKDCGGAESHGRGYHVRGVCVCVSGAERGTGGKGCNGRPIVSVFDFFLGTCEGELFGILGTPTKIVGVVQSKENFAANADVPSAPFCIAALLVTIVVAWR